MLYFAGKYVRKVKMTELQSCNAKSLVRLPETRFYGRQFGLTASGLWQTLQQLLLNKLIKPYLDFLLPLKVILSKKKFNA